MTTDTLAEVFDAVYGPLGYRVYARADQDLVVLYKVVDDSHFFVEIHRNELEAAPSVGELIGRKVEVLANHILRSTYQPGPVPGYMM